MVISANYSFGEYKVIEAFDKTWIRIFYHDISTGRVFHSNEEANYTRKKSKYVFSVIKFIDEDFMIYNETNKKFYYEFYLEYPTLDNVTIHWLQETHPLSNVPKTGIVPLQVKGNGFGGLVSSESDYTFIDGNVNSTDWWYSIGSKVRYQGNLMPGPCYNLCLKVPLVSLWIHINNMSLLQKLPFAVCKTARIHCSRRNNIVLIIIILIVSDK